MKKDDYPFVKVEIYFDKAERFGDSYRPHLAPTEFPHEMLGVWFDYFPQVPAGEKFIATARLIYDGVDYSTLINGTEFLIKEGSRTVGHGKVITVNDLDFAEFPKFAEYLHNKASGKRKPAIDALHHFIESISNDKDSFSAFCIYLCKVLDTLQYQQSLIQTIRPGHWFNEKIKSLLYDYFISFVKENDCEFNYIKWHCLYARSFNLENNEGYELCEQALKRCEYKDKALVSFYVRNQIQWLSIAIHELPIGYLGSDDPYEDLDLINELRRMLTICYGDDHSTDFSDIEGEIKGYIKDRRIKREHR